MIRTVAVALPVPRLGLLTYAVPIANRDGVPISVPIAPGVRVSVPLGTSGSLPNCARRRGSPEPDLQLLAPLATANRLDEIRRIQFEMPIIELSGTDLRRRAAEVARDLEEVDREHRRHDRGHERRVGPVVQGPRARLRPAESHALQPADGGFARAHAARPVNRRA